MSSAQLPTMQQIADRVGVTRATVSMALRDHPKITPSRRAEIQRVAAEMGYHPHPMISSLMTQLRRSGKVTHTSFIAFLCYHPDPILYHPEKGMQFYRDIFTACLKRADELGYNLELLWARQPGMRGARLRQILDTRATAGLIIPPIPRDCDPLDLAFDRFAVVKIGYTAAQTKVHRIVPDHAQAMRRSLRFLTSAGFRRIGFLFHRQVDLHTNYEFLAFALRHTFEAGSDGIPPLLVENYHPVPATVDPIRAYLSRWNPEIILTDHAHTLDVLEAMGVSIPRDISLFLMNTAHATRPCSGFRQNLPLLGAETVNLLDNLVRHNQRGLPPEPITIKVGGEIVDGPTLAVKSAING